MKKNIIIALLTIAVIFIFVRGISCNKPLPEKPNVTPPSEVRKNVAVAEMTTNKKIDSLQQMVDEERKNADKYKSNLRSAQDRARKLETTLSNLVNTTVEPQPPAGSEYEPIKPDSAAIFSLIENSRLRDSLANTVIESQEKQLLYKDSISAERLKLYATVRQSLDKSLTDQDALTKYSSDLRRQLKRAKADGYIWKGAGVAAGLFIIKLLVSK